MKATWVPMIAFFLPCCSDTAVAQIQPIVKPSTPTVLAAAPLTLKARDASGSARETFVSVMLAGPQPGGYFSVISSGGYQPLKFSIDAGANGALFELSPAPAFRPIAAVTAVQSAARVAAADLTANTTAVASGGGGLRLAAETTQWIHFKGFASLAGMPLSMPVRVTVTDGAGATKTITVTLELKTFRVAQVTVPAGMVRGRLDNVAVRLAGLPAGASVTVEATGNRVFDRADTVYVPHTPTASDASVGAFVNPVCTFDASSDSRITGTADAAGDVALTLPGRFHYDAQHPQATAAKDGPCQLALRLSGGTNDYAFLAATERHDVRITPVTTYRIDSTWDLSSKVNFAMSPGLPGFCTGYSVLGTSVYPIGVFKDGNDLAMAVRSGPTGADCVAQSQAWLLPPDVAVTAIDWDVQTDGSKCCLADRCLPPDHAPTQTVVVPGSIPSEDPQLYDSNAPSSENAPRRPFLSPMHARLACGTTVLNDHGVKVVLKSLTLEGPLGLRLP
ncbi:MAG: hypothetical protein U1F11_01490 [Steroidobacteraceae bacterium]